MLKYPVFKDSIRFYKYKFAGIEDPVEIEAVNKYQARNILNETIIKTTQLQNRPLLGESVSLPIFGHTTKEVEETTFIWVGFENTGSGWMKLEDYERAEKK